MQRSPLGTFDDLYDDDVDRRRDVETLEWALEQMKLNGEEIDDELLGNKPNTTTAAEQKPAAKVILCFEIS